MAQRARLPQMRQRGAPFEGATFDSWVELRGRRLAGGWPSAGRWLAVGWPARVAAPGGEPLFRALCLAFLVQTEVRKEVRMGVPTKYLSILGRI